MICIYCFHTKTKVSNSRTQKKAPIVWRRRTCLRCLRSFSSYERPSTAQLTVVGPDHTQTPFSIGKLTLSIAASFSHDTHTAEFNSMDLAQTVELQLLRLSNETTITPSKIAEYTHQTLKRYDELAAVQYAAKHQLIATIRRRGRPSITSFDQTS